MRKNKTESSNFQMPKWMDCTWKRIPCGKDDCKICGRIKRDRQRHMEAGENPDDIKCVLEDMGRSFRETLDLVKKDAKRMGIDLEKIGDKEIEEPPGIEDFPLCKELMEWYREILKITEKKRNLNHPWIQNETARDLFWYSNLLPVKTYRQLCNRWEMGKGDDCVKDDYEYTKRVLRESLEIIKMSLNKLIIHDVALLVIYVKLNGMEKDILEI